MNTILIEVGKILIPFIQIFGIYVIFNGHISPGGGFAGGTIMGVSLILSTLIYNLDKKSNKLSYEKAISIMGLSLTVYAILKGYSFLVGGLDLHMWEVPIGVAGRIFSAGLILPLNIMVGIVVALTIYVFYCMFDRGDI